jgi:hypothetical protein
VESGEGTGSVKKISDRALTGYTRLLLATKNEPVGHSDV